MSTRALCFAAFVHFLGVCPGILANELKTLPPDAAYRFRAGADQARTCLDYGLKSTSFRNNKYFNFGDCIIKKYPTTKYMNHEEFLEAVSFYISAYFIQIDYFGKIDPTPNGYGLKGGELAKAIRALYRDSVDYLHENNADVKNICAAVSWVDCAKLSVTIDK
jgi:hypothetical protein